MRKNTLFLIILLALCPAFLKSQNAVLSDTPASDNPANLSYWNSEDFEKIMSFWDKGFADLKQKLDASDNDYKAFLLFNKEKIENETGNFFTLVKSGTITLTNVSSCVESKMKEFSELYKKYLAVAKEFPSTADEYSHIPVAPANVCNPGCSNIGFEDGNLSGWYAYYAVNNSTTARNVTGVTGGAAGAVQKAAKDPNTGNTYQVHLTSGTATDWFLDTYSSHVMSQVSPYGGNYSCMIGDSINNNKGVAILEQTFQVGPSNPNLTIQFSLFMELPAHTYYEQPFYDVFFIDEAGDTVRNCGLYKIISPNPDSAFKSLHSLGFVGVYYPPRTDTIYWKDWTTINVNLTPFNGQCVTVGFEVSDCEPSAHCAWAYVDASCTPNDIITSSPAFCGQDSIILTAPPGFVAYKWYGGPVGGIHGVDTNQRVQIDSVGTYCVIATPITGIHCSDTICIYIPKVGGTPPHPTFTVNQAVCSGQQVCFTNTSTPDSIQGAKFYWDFYNLGLYNDSLVNPCWVYNAAGTYTVKLHEVANGCGADTFVTINVAPINASVLVNANSTACTSTGSASLTPCGGKLPYTYSWSPNGGTSNSDSGLSAGTYTITIKDNTGITTTVTATITAPGALTVNTVVNTNATACANSGSTTASASGGTSPYTYSWSSGEGTNQTISNLSAGTYTITATDNSGCISTATTTITQPAALGITISSITNVSCFGGTGSATASAASGGTSPYSYSWSPGGGSGLVASNLSAGTYTLAATDNTGCSSTTATTITQPTALGIGISSITNVTCNGGTGSATASVASGGTSPYTYSWSPSGGSGLVASNLGAGTYTITITDNSECTSTASVTITEPAFPLGITISSTTNVSCNGATGSVTANAATGGTPPFTYSWSPGGGTNVTASAISAGTYTITVTDNNGCTATASATITQPATALGITIASVSDVSCRGGTGSVTASAATGGTSPYTYSWSSSEGSNLTASNLNAGTYTITVRDNYGCKATASVTVTQPAAALSVNVSIQTNVSCFGGNNGSAEKMATGGTSPYTYSWTSGVGTNQTLSNLSAGTYTVIVTDNYGCTVTAYSTITQPPSELGISISSVSEILCNGGTGSATANSATGGTSYSTSSFISTIAGTGGAGYNNDGIPASSAELHYPSGVVADGLGNIYIADYENNRIRKINSYGIISTIAGTGTGGYNGDGIAATSAELSDPRSLTMDGSGNIYIADANNQRIREVNTSGIISTIAGTGIPGYNGDGIAATTAKLDLPYGVAVDGSGNIYIADSYNNRVREVSTAGIISTIAGNGIQGYDGNGASATSAELYTPFGITTDGSGDVLFSESGNSVVREVNTSGNIILLAGDGHSGYTGDGIAATATDLNSPEGIALDGSGNIYIADASNSRVRIVGYGSIATIAGDGIGGFSGDGGPPTSAELGGPFSVTFDGSGNFYIADGPNQRIRKVAPGFSAPYTYSWTPSGGTNLTATGLTVGTYTITVTDADGCTATASVTITQPATLGITISSVSDVSCGEGGSATANSATGGTSPYTYSWTSGGGTNLSATGLSAGTYSVNVTDSNSCTATASVTITAPTTLSANAVVNSNTTSCTSEGSATVSASGGTSPYTYSWTGGSTNANATGLSAGSYTVTVTDNSTCTATASVTITAPGAVSANAIVNNEATGCASNGSATVFASGGTSPYTYSWTGGSTNANATGLSAGSYTVTVTDNSTCTATASVTITAPGTLTANAIVNNEATDCASNGNATVSASGGTSPYTYSWTGGSTNANATRLSAGSYTVTVTDNSTCTATASVTITAPGTITANAIVNNEATGCASNGSATVSASGGTSPYTYSWTGGSTNANATGLSAGSYTVTVTDNSTCTATASVTITAPGALTANAIVNNEATGCASNGSATVSASGGTSPYTYSWTGGSTNANATGLSAGSYTVTVTDNSTCTTTASVTITAPGAITANAVVNSEATGCASNGSATVSASGGTSPYTYSWTGGSTNANATGLSAGSYTVTVTDNSTCTTTASVTITAPGALTANAIVNNEATGCASNGSATVSASGGTSPYTYSWTGGSTNANATGLSAGSYTVTVTDNSTCTTTASVTITAPGAITANAIVNNEATGCASNGSATVSASGGTSPYTYSWTGGSTNANATGLSAGSYTVTVTDNSTCTATASVTITAPGALTANAIVNNETTGCASNGSATVSASGGTSPYTYSWTGGSTNANATGLSAGSYTVTVTDNSTCTATASVTITAPGAITAKAIVNNEATGCASNGSATVSASGGTSPYTYSWTGGSTNANATGLSAGSYTVTVTDNSTCTATASVTITAPGAITANAVVNSEATGCASNGSATVSASGGTSPYTYSWTGGSTNANATGLSAGSYTVTVTDNSTCTTTASVTITAPGALTANAIVNNEATGCASNGSATVSASGGTSPYTYSWTGGSTNANATGLSAGSYSVTLSDNNGCTATASATITQPISLSITISSVVNASCFGGTGSATASAATGGTSPYTYSWSPGGGTNLAATGLSAGTYTITAKDNHGCSASVSTTITQPTSALGITISSVTNISCNGEGSATASAATGGTSPYTYSWSPGGGTNLAATGLSAGTYTITAKDNHGCTATVSATITQPASALGITISSVTDVSCHGGVGTATASAATGGTSPYTYSWSPGGGTNLAATGLSAGTYTITAKDNHGCTATADVTVTQPASALGITISSVTHVSCYGGVGTATANAATGGTSPYTYSWSPGGGTNLAATGLSAGTYTITAKDNHGCSASVSATITQPTSALGITISSVTDVSCHGGVGSATASAATGGTSPYTYSWSPGGGTNLAATGLSAGTYTITAKDNHGCSASVSATITQPTSALGITISSVTNLSCHGGVGTATASAATGGTSPYTYSWSPGGGTNLAATGLSAGTYTITAKDNHGCSASVSATITQPTSALGITISSVTDVSCHGGVGTATANAATGGTSPYTYSWSPGGGTNLAATGLSAGTYTITAKDNHGCTATADVTVTQPASALGITISSVTHVSCYGGVGSATASAATGGTSPYTYSWSPGGGTNLAATGLSAGTYTITAKDNHGCTATADITVTQPASALGITISSVTDINCHGGVGSATASAATGGTSPYTYSWSPGGGTNLAATGLSAGTYTITATDKHGCTATADVTITQPASALGITISSVTDVSCHGGVGSATASAATGGTSPYTYRWTSSGGTNLTATGLSAGTYTITATDKHGCTATADVTITQPASALGITISSVTHVSCFGGVGSATASAATGGTSPYTYSWSPGGGTNLAATGLSAGTYTITATDKHGCTATADVTITQPASALGITISSVTNVSCTGEDDGKATAHAATGGTAPYTYSWAPGGGTSLTASGLSAGTYTLTVTDDHGCTTTLHITITQPAEAMVIKTDSTNQSTTPCNGVASVTVLRGGTTPYTYKWTTGGQTTSSITGQCAGTYCCIVKDNHDCSETVCVTIKNTTGIENISNSLAITIYPNPNTGQFTIAGVERGMLIEVYDDIGRKIRATTATDETMQINISTEANGVYLIGIIDKDGISAIEKKVLKIK